MFAARQLSLARPVAGCRLFHASAPTLVKVGDKLPNVELMENSPGNKVNIAEELKSGKGLIIGVPAAYSPACSENHIPGYINSAKLKDAGKVFVVSVNDSFVMKAWGKTLDPTGSSGIRFLADPSLAFTKGLDLSFDGASVFGGDRSKRYALVIEDGAVKEAHVESDNTGLNVSAADKVL
ncbi:AhpC/TSA family protein [Macroventuria anomochaeta]|uniref:AhpC/TSA family protein n=1 Tax=Macroventuria anomochaeta TaxID=301207 RepID=A0ACB6SBT0_9PLEO|nr:AhpC/TSA family protein [Macroventuria anomochaeta]KAF2631755.1 AhpC/TSA family protein [Macroventuria anomochaeta]